MAHSARGDKIDFDSLDAKNALENMKLAFSVLEVWRESHVLIVSLIKLSLDCGREAVIGCRGHC